jgi:hypothetical protein
MKRFALPCLHFYWVFANVNSLEFVAKSWLINPFIKLCFLGLIHSCLIMPHSNQKRHNPPSIPHTPYHYLIIPCPNFDPIYQVILLENPNEWNLFLAKRRTSQEKKRRERIEKQMRWNLIWRAPGTKKEKREDEIYKLLGEILSKERKKGDAIFL